MSTPGATYRLQLRPEFGFEDGAAIADYLAALGVSHVFCSPILTAAPGSQHGYDVADPEAVNPDLGGEEGFTRWCAVLRRCGLGQILDIVPNHMGIATARNRWWWDVLRRGEASPYAHYFDIAWRHPATGVPRKLVLPWLRQPLGTTLAAGGLRIEGELLRYGAMELPLAPGSTAHGDMATILARQHYRLTHWKVSDFELPYRRFFDASHLIGVRQEDEEVFAATHRRVVGWLQSGLLDGVRVDHVDGLREPLAYLRRLRQAAPGAWIVVEKILGRQEHLNQDWPVAGTTGYDFLNLVTGLWLDPAGAAPLEACYRAFIAADGEQVSSFPAVAMAGKRQVLGDLLHSELRWLSELAQRRLHQPTLVQLDRALGELAAQWHVYRSYVPAAGVIAPADAALLHAAHAAARASQPDLAALLDAVYALLISPGQRELLLRFQQLTPAVLAKGVEDTAFYRWFRLSALNEVGGDPERFGTRLEEFHAHCATAQQHWPNAMLATSTHDTKRGEDVRARLCLLSEIPARWREAVLAWQLHNRQHHRPAGPDANTEYLFYQTLVGAWPIGAERLQAYLLKAVREAKAHTSWRLPQAAYERALQRFVAGALADRDWMRQVEQFVAPLIAPGRVTSLAQVLLKLTAPGVPDIYNGAELWELNLVDPDNRRDVDFGLRRRLLAELASAPAPEAIWARQDEGLPKLWTVQRALRLRRERPAVFAAGSTYEPLWATGPQAEHVLAFVRGNAVAAVVPRLLLRHSGWPQAAAATTLALPSGRWRNWLSGEVWTGEACPVPELFKRFPVALLAREGEP
ncbi:MAG: malto-oligosyltrehalose synthase [Terriglobales bacterium]